MQGQCLLDPIIFSIVQEKNPYINQKNKKTDIKIAKYGSIAKSYRKDAFEKHKNIFLKYVKIF